MMCSSFRTAPKIAGTNVEPDASLKKGRKHLVGYVGVMGNADGVRYIVEAADFLVREAGSGTTFSFC